MFFLSHRASMFDESGMQSSKGGVKSGGYIHRSHGVAARGGCDLFGAGPGPILR